MGYAIQKRKDEDKGGMEGEGRQKERERGEKERGRTKISAKEQGGERRDFSVKINDEFCTEDSIFFRMQAPWEYAKLREERNYIVIW